MAALACAADHDVRLGQQQRQQQHAADLAELLGSGCGPSPAAGASRGSGASSAAAYTDIDVVLLSAGAGGSRCPSQFLHLDELPSPLEGGPRGAPAPCGLVLLNDAGVLEGDLVHQQQQQHQQQRQQHLPLCSNAVPAADSARVPDRDSGGSVLSAGSTAAVHTNPGVNGGSVLRSNGSDESSLRAKRPFPDAAWQQEPRWQHDQQQQQQHEQHEQQQRDQGAAACHEPAHPLAQVRRAAPAAAKLAAAATATAAAADKRTGPCCHCGVTSSPQWRKGPPGKPVLCNACGTRYRRTQKLDRPPVPPGGA